MHSQSYKEILLVLLLVVKAFQVMHTCVDTLKTERQVSLVMCFIQGYQAARKNLPTLTVEPELHAAQAKPI